MIMIKKWKEAPHQDIARLKLRIRSKWQIISKIRYLSFDLHI